MNREIEEQLLLKSHDAERVKELLDTRYSLSGDQKPILVLTPTTSNRATPKSESPAPQPAAVRPEPYDEERKVLPNVERTKKERHISHSKNVRQGLRKYIAEAKRAQHAMEKHLHSKNNQGSSSSSSSKVPQYDSFLPLHDLWRGYISDLVFGGGGQSPNPLAAAGKMATADYHGALIEVMQARNPSLVGVRGIVVWEGRSSFVVVVGAKSGPLASARERIGGLRIIEKKGVRFLVTVESAPLKMDFELIGSRLLFRTAERSGRKFKPKGVRDV
ncbi:RNases MRP/P 32.9 kDa subunit [Trichomonascus vanleenenianus]|uniref:RNase P/RNase MRP complex subunit n=1 Tax=Trichomonascus vanleenenianus TaxID=2268995 RepID=UPI003ECA3A84